MQYTQAELEKIKACLPAYLKEKGITNLRKHFRCLSPTHQDRHPSMSYSDRLNIVHCFSCGFTADIISLYAMDHNLDEQKDFQQILSELSERYLYKTWVAKKSEHENCPYLKSRGLTEQTIKHYHVETFDDYVLNNKHLGPCIRIPYSSSPDAYSIFRSTVKKKYCKPKDIEEPVFWEKELDQLEPVVIVESAICAMSIHQTGFHSVALNGTGTYRLLNAIASRDSVPPLILCLDQDEAGKQAQARLIQQLEEVGCRYAIVPGLNGAKDPNELICLPSGEEILRTILTETINSLAGVPEKKTESLYDYLIDGFVQEQEAMVGRELYTGIDALDKQVGKLRPGLYMIGGIPSCGKTSMMLQIALNLAKQEQPVLYISYEAKKRDISAKLLSHLSKDSIRPYSMQDVLDLPKDKLLQIIPSLTPYAKYLNIMDSNARKEDIQKKLDEYIVPPVVVIDYIQVMPLETRNKTKERIDDLVNWLYQIQQKKDLILFVVSSFNRTNYFNAVSLDSFKESGDLEFRSDIIYGLQYRICSEDPIFLSDTKLAERKAKIEKEKKRIRRRMELVCLKNRFGISSFSVPLEFDGKYSWFG